MSVTLHLSAAPMVKWISRLSSEQLFQVRVLVGAQNNAVHIEKEERLAATPLVRTLWYLRLALRLVRDEHGRDLHSREHLRFT